MGGLFEEFDDSVPKAPTTKAEDVLALASTKEAKTLKLDDIVDDEEYNPTAKGINQLLIKRGDK